MPKLSVIIPVYNTENYLRRCLDSVINQTFKDIEIIIINDASIDNSQAIIDEYKKIDNRIVSIVNKKNIGAGKTRNIGIEKATGEYLAFVDSDDWLENEMYEKMIKLITESKADIVECNAKQIKNNNLYIRLLVPYFKKDTASINKYAFHLSKNKLSVTIWNKIYRTNIIKSNGIKFENEKQKLSEDLLFNLQVAYFTNYIITINRSFYNYFYRPESISNSNNSYLKTVINTINFYIEKNSKLSSFKSDFSAFSLIILSSIKNILLNSSNKHTDIKNNTINILKKIRKEKIFSLILKEGLKNKTTSLKDRFFCLLLLLKMYYIIILLIMCFKKLKKITNKK